MKRILFPLLFSLSGCAGLAIVEQSRVEEAVGTLPAAGSPAHASIGETLFSQYRYWRKTGYTLADSVTVSIGGGTVVANAGEFLFKAQVDGGVAFCTEKPTFKMIVGAKTACFVDKNGDGSFDQVKVASEVNWWGADLKPPAKYQVGEIVIPKLDAMKRELLYQGYSKGVLKLSYREYVNDMARPAFFQDVTYDVDTFPTEVSFKAARLKLLKAGNNGIEYIVLTPFQ